jgi:hypothetical protein
VIQADSLRHERKRPARVHLTLAPDDEGLLAVPAGSRSLAAVVA